MGYDLSVGGSYTSTFKLGRIDINGFGTMTTVGVALSQADLNLSIMRI